MKVSLSWLKELVKYDLADSKLAEKLSLNSIGVKSQTKDYLELDLTYNRGDLLSMRGVAREIAAITDSEITFKESTGIDKISRLAKFVSKLNVDVKDKHLALVYCLAKIENFKVEKSHETWVKKLSDSGLRSINNVADITNLVMMEYGQPMHAFDVRAVKDEAIIVRTAKKGERITTLDGKTRDLDISDLLISDSLNSLGIAGVMGGKDSEVTDSTKTILLEAAIFDPVSNRNSAKRHGLSTEASKRFQHGLTKSNLLQALSAAIKMYESLGGKLTAINLAGDLEDKPKKLNLNQDKINSLLGILVAPELVESYLKKLGFTLASQGPTLRGWEVTVPYWRLDINIEEDLIEEVARMYGYDKIAGQPLKDESSEEIDQTFYNFIYDLKVDLKDAGLTEVQTYSFYSTDVLNILEWDKKNLVKIANPISSEAEYLREDLWPNLLEVVVKNAKHGFKDIAFFEVGKIYKSVNGDLPDETYRLSCALLNESNRPILELAQIVEDALKKLKIGIILADSPKDKLYFRSDKLFHSFNLKSNGKTIGGLAEVHPRYANKFGIEKRVAVLEIELEPLL